MLDTSKIYTTNNHGNLEIIEYLSSVNVVVKFIGYEHTVVTSAQNIRNGEVRNVMLPVVFGVGFTGIGNYSKTKDKKAYSTWASMLNRCYSPKVHAKRPTYIDCSVTPEWHNFQNFAVWFYENYKEGLHLDKDILVQGNKVYAPEKCMFVTKEINNLLLDSTSRRGEYKRGVTKYQNRYKAQYNDSNKKKTHIGMFTTEQEAHEAYIEYKYALIKQVADKQTEPLKSSLLKWRL